MNENTRLLSKSKDKISTEYKLMEANKKLDMGRKNKILTILSHGSYIFTHLHQLCNSGNSQEFRNVLRDMIAAGDINTHVNGRILYVISPQGKAKVKQLRKQCRLLFSA